MVIGLLSDNGSVINRLFFLENNGSLGALTLSSVLLIALFIFTVIFIIHFHGLIHHTLNSFLGNGTYNVSVYLLRFRTRSVLNNCNWRKGTIDRDFLTIVTVFKEALRNLSP